MCYYCKNIATVDLSSLQTISGDNSCYYMFCCDSGTTTPASEWLNRAYTGALDLSSLTTISGSSATFMMFAGWINMTSVDLSSLTTVSGSYCGAMFRNCTSLSSIDLSSLTTISGNMAWSGNFSYAGLINVSFPVLSTLTGSQALYQCFYKCTSLQHVYFYALHSSSFGSYTDQFNAMLAQCSNVTVHFPSNLQSTIASWSSVTNGFSGTNTTVLFDLPIALVPTPSTPDPGIGGGSN